MKQPTRLHREHQGDLTAALLEAMRAERPARTARERTLLAVTAIGAGTSAGLTTAGALAHGVPALTAIRWLVIGASAGVLVGGVGQMARSRAPDTSPSVTVHGAARARPSPRTGSPSSSRNPSVAEVEVAPSTDPLPVQIGAAPGATGPRAMNHPRAQRSVTTSTLMDESVPAAAPPLTGPTLAAELSALDRVNQALAAHRPEVALRLLDAYCRDYPAGSLATEAAVLRVQGWLERGDRARAEQLGQRLLEASPQGPHARRVRSLLGGDSVIKRAGSRQDPG